MYSIPYLHIQLLLLFVDTIFFSSRLNLKKFYRKICYKNAKIVYNSSNMNWSMAATTNNTNIFPTGFLLSLFLFEIFDLFYFIMLNSWHDTLQHGVFRIIWTLLKLQQQQQQKIRFIRTEESLDWIFKGQQHKNDDDFIFFSALSFATFV